MKKNRFETGMYLMLNGGIFMIIRLFDYIHKVNETEQF